EDPERDEGKVREPGLDDRDGDRDQHRDAGLHDPLPRRRGRAHRPKAENERDDRDDVDRVDERLLPGDHRGPPFFLERSNIARIRSVTTYPPVTFIAPMMTATKPIASSSGVVAMPRATIAPTRTIPWMKFDPDINGVWSRTGTRLMTS